MITKEEYLKLKNHFWVLADKEKKCQWHHWIISKNEPKPISNSIKIWRRPTYEEAVERSRISAYEPEVFTKKCESASRYFHGILQV